MKNLSYYIHCFTHLKRDNKNGGAPHKPILLLSLLHQFEKNPSSTNEIFISAELVSSFKSNWNKLVHTQHHANFALPFYHMNSEPFWRLLPNLGCETWIESKSSMRNFSNLTTAVHSVIIDIELFDLLLIPENRDVLKLKILEKYFPNSQFSYQLMDGDDLPSGEILHENSEQYKAKIAELKNEMDENEFQEEIFIRNGIFKREIPKIYNFTCAISGMRIDAVGNISMVDACHIVPFSESYDDTLTNGIALSPNLHRAFDRGLIAISDDYTVLIRKDFVENQNSRYNLSQFENHQILLPDQHFFHPSLENLRHHRKRFAY